MASRCLWRALLLVLSTSALAGGTADATIVKFFTNLGSFSVRLYDSAMPNTVNNFLNYAADDDWDNTFVHRNVPGFVIQGGGFIMPPNGDKVVERFGNGLGYGTNVGFVPTDAPISDEPGGGVAGPSNVRGTIAMAKSGPNTVTSQWFINVDDNSGLDDPARDDGGFSAFGRVLGNGMAVVDAINALSTPANPVPALDAAKVQSQNLEYFTDDVVVVSDIRDLGISPGDYNFDGIVNNADLNVWRNTFGSTTLAEADGNGDGVVNAADYTVWRDDFLASSSAAAVPEPAVAAMLASLVGLGRRRR